MSKLRNLEEVSIPLAPGLNVLFGLNGAGKTSVLESIHFLSQARSFKARNPRQLIALGEDAFVVRGEVVSGDRLLRVGISRGREVTAARINGNKVPRLSELAEVLPAQVIHPDTFSLLVGARSERRAFLDWGAFYHCGEFRRQWAVFQKALRQRNAAIKSRLAVTMVNCWDEQLAMSGEAIATYREDYLSKVVGKVPELIERFSDSTKLSVSYQQGWPSGKRLVEHLGDNIEADIARGYTSGGPQRGGFEVRYNGHPISEVGSRGQVKLATVVFKLAQLQLFQEQGGRECILLLDDLDSELDNENLKRFLSVVVSLRIQTLLTTVDRRRILDCVGDQVRLFHVEHGCVEQVV